ncbi:cytochrome P450 [Mycena floridula]|nr:cytochrome P450 [Mycena floridula]
MFPGRWILGSFAYVVAVIHEAISGFPGETVLKTAENGTTAFSFRVFLESSIRVLTADPQHIKAIHTTQFENFERGAGFSQDIQSILGSALFNVDGDTWRAHRTMARPFFKQAHITIVENLGRHADTMIELARDRFSSGYSVDFQELLTRFTLDVSTEFLFGNDLGSLRSTSLPYPFSTDLQTSRASGGITSLSEAVDSLQRAMVRRVRLGGLWPAAELWDNRVSKARAVINDYLKPAVSAAIERRSRGLNPETLLDHMVIDIKDHAYILDEITSMMLAGRDTTTSALTFILYMLAEHSDVLETLRREIFDVLGPVEIPSLQKIKSMPFLKAVIQETLRLYPPIPMGMRTSRQATVLPGSSKDEPGTFIPANTRVAYSFFALHRRSDLWGSDAHVFNPRRFMDGEISEVSSFYFPFALGPRNCIGQQLALNEISFLLVRLLQSFKTIALDNTCTNLADRPPEHWRTSNTFKKGEKVWPRSNLTMYIKGGLWLKMIEAD